MHYLIQDIFIFDIMPVTIDIRTRSLKFEDIGKQK